MVPGVTVLWTNNPQITYCRFMNKTVVLQIPDKVGMNQYLLASEVYIQAKRYSRMAYPFPVISASCPLCKAAGCAIWRGYYERNLFCSEMDFFGKVAIHCGVCRTKREFFSMQPSFLFPTEG